MKALLLQLLAILGSININAQYWQQAVDYKMNVSLDPKTANYSGTTSGSPTVTTSGSDTIMVFNASGSYTA